MTDQYNLCAYCVCADGCTYPHDTNRLVLHCDEFVGVSSAKPNPTSYQRGYTNSDMQTNSARGNSQSGMGLCGTCDKRDSCTFPKPEGGVWHCEEFN